MFKRILAATLTLCALAAAQEIPPVSTNDQPTPPVEIEPAPMPPTNVPVPLVQPAKLDGVSAKLSSAGSEAGGLKLTLTLNSTLNKAVKIMAGRDNRQDCNIAPLVRVLRVGSREVVYPNGSGNAMLCAQDMKTDTLPAGGILNYSRDLKLGAGEYMIESWFYGFADDLRVKVSAQPVRVTVK